MTSHLSSAGASAPKRVDTSTEQKPIPTCFNVNRRQFKCRRSCCNKKEVVQDNPQYIPFFTADRFCVMCKRKYYASGVQCMLGHFNCIPNPQ